MLGQLFEQLLSVWVVYHHKMKGGSRTTNQLGVTSQAGHVAAQAFEAGGPDGVVVIPSAVALRSVPLQVFYEGTAGESFFICHNADPVAQNGKVQNKWV